MKRRPICWVLLLLAIGAVYAAGGEKKKLTYRLSLGRGSESRLLNPLPKMEGWLDDEHYLERKTLDLDQEKYYSIRASDGQAVLFMDPDSLNKKLSFGLTLERALSHSQDHIHFLFEEDQDLYYFNARSGLFKRLTDSPAKEQTPQFSPDYRWVAFTRDHNLFVVEVKSGQERQLTQDGSAVILNGYHSWVYYEEVYHRSYRGFWWSPKNDRVAFARYDDSAVPLFTLFRADSVHGQLETARYPKAGDPNPKVRLGIVDLVSGHTVWLRTNEKADDYLAQPFWSHDGGKLYFQWMNRGQDSLKIFSADPSTGACQSVYAESQPSFVEFFEDVYLFQDGSGMILQSDQTGWAHLYLVDIRAKTCRQLTHGEWPVKKLSAVDEKKGLVFFTASKDHSSETHLYQVGRNGKNFSQLTFSTGTHLIQASPSGKYFIDTWSSISQPRKMELISNRGKIIRRLGDANSPTLAEYQLGRTEGFSIPTGDGYDLPAVWILPSHFDPGKKYPILMYVYGGPAAPMVSNSWQGLRPHYYTENGIIWLMVDHRGSGHFGKKGVALMHRRLGKWEMNDYIAAAKWLRRQPFVDSTRIAITGGSYGGYMTCMALTYGADYFTHGIAEFSVTDYRLYDSIYTERYMDTPAENPNGYDSTAVMTWADRYKGLLRITHGTMDDNVHMQNTIQLIDKLQDLNKHFELMLYPNSRHGYGPAKGRHSGEESMRFWFRHLLNREWSPEE